MKSILLILSLLLFNPLIAKELPKTLPKELLGTHKAQFKELKTAGKLIGCSIDYTVLHKNPLSTFDSFYTVGHVSTILANNRIIMTFKFGLQPLSNLKSTTNVNFAYLQSGQIDTSALENISFEETKGFKTFGYLIDDATAQILSNMAESNSITISYNLTDGGLDHSFNVDLSVKEIEISATGVEKIRNPNTGILFRECTIKLIDLAIDEFNRTKNEPNT